MKCPRSKTISLQDDHFHDHCGVFGIYNHPEAAKLTYLGIYALQHRGQESAGIASAEGKNIHVHKQMGLVADIFQEEQLNRLEGMHAIGHVRYSTQGETLIENAQPITVNYSEGPLAIAHNGNLVNSQALYEELQQKGSIFQTTSDTEVLVHLIAGSKKAGIVNRLIEALKRARGAYSLVLLTPGALIAVRDPYGFRPLVLGKLKNSLIVSSETCSLDLIEAEYLREVEPGELVVINKEGIHSEFPFEKVKPHPCIFEHIYFARPDSNVFGESVYEVRRNLGRELARVKPIEADVVVPVPDSGVPAALGYAEESKIPFAFGIIRNHYVGRTFIEPEQSIRHFGVKVKLNAVKEIVSGKRVILVDDSIVRGTTARKIVKMIRDAGANEVHMRISAPPTTHSCFYGIDTPTQKELIAHNHTIDEINTFLTSNSLGYLTRESLYRRFGPNKKSFCDACFSGEYPVDISKDNKARIIIPLVNHR